MEKQLSYIANRIVIESVMQKENLNTSVDVVHPTNSTKRGQGDGRSYGCTDESSKVGADAWRQFPSHQIVILLVTTSSL